MDTMSTHTDSIHRLVDLAAEKGMTDTLLAAWSLLWFRLKDDEEVELQSVDCPPSDPNCEEPPPP